MSYAGFALVGVNSGVNGVLLVAQMRDYGVDRATFGVTFFVLSAGFVLAGLSSGGLIGRFGPRATLIAGASAYALASLGMAARPPFAAFAAVQLVTGWGAGILESGLNTYLAARPGATTLLNRLHAFWGTGSLAGPVLATWMTGFSSWTAVMLVLAAACLPVIAGFTLFPGPGPAAGTGPEAASGPERGLLGEALRDRAIRAGAVMLAVYVGLEVGVGTWAFSYLTQSRGLGSAAAGYAVSGYWLGLTVGRFVISPLAERAGLAAGRMLYGCLAGAAVASGLAWMAPGPATTSAALAVLGFFLGPVFPTMMAVTPRLARRGLVPTAIGVMNSGSVIGGAALPWLAGVIAQGSGMWTLLPYAIVLALVQVALWRPLAARLMLPAASRARSGDGASPRPGEPERPRRSA